MRSVNGQAALTPSSTRTSRRRLTSPSKQFQKIGSMGRPTEPTRSFEAFSRGKIVSDDDHAPGVEIGRPRDTYRRIRIESDFGKLTVLVTDGHLPYPYGREITGYEVASLADTLAKAKRAGVKILVAPYQADQRTAAIAEFPGGYIAEIHSAVHQ
jgi:hypothetical protein